MSSCQATNSFWPHYLHQHSLDSGKPHQDSGDRFPPLQTVDQLGNEANINSFSEKTWQLRLDELGPHPGLGLLAGHTQPGVHPHGRVRRLRKVCYKCLVMGENPQVQTALVFLWHHCLPSVIYGRNLMTMFVYKHVSVFMNKNKWYKCKQKMDTNGKLRTRLP